jgi:RNA polymerase sigma-70 factor (ECF subfamily)
MTDANEEQKKMVPGVVELDRKRGGIEGVDGKHKPADREIADAIEAGDHRRAVVLCSRHHGAAIGRLAMSMTGSQQDAEDVVQETLIDAYGSLASWRGEGSIRSWLLSIARRKCARLIERRTRRTAKLRLVHDADRAPSSDDNSEGQVLKRERADKARAALSGIRPSEREALLMRFGAGLSFREVGVACGIDETAARKRVSRAIAHLRNTLDEGGQDQ